MQNENYRLRVRFDGRVQGVGFRYKTKSLAEGYDVSGYVENLDDGGVMLVAVGEKGEVRAFVDKVSEVMADFIRERSEREDFADKPYRGFEIRL